jgi:decaprenylphospho-beta-D-ribofuranose 2-oxidase
VADLRSEALTGWGGAISSVAHVAQPQSVDDLAELVRGASERGVIARGLGRSYGDVAQNGGGLVLKTKELARIVAFDLDRGTVTAQGGCSLAHLIDVCGRSGWFLPVTPGTRFVTIGGAIACDVHGKNHHVDGAFGSHIRDMELLTADGERHRLDPVGTPGPFWATVGGLGLTGVIVEATLQLLRMPVPAIRMTIERTDTLDDTLTLLAETDANYRYSVAWVDAAAAGRKLGRAVVTQGDHADSATQAGLPTPRAAITVPAWASIAPLLRGRSTRLLNDLYYRRAPRRAERVVPLAPFFYPLDAIGSWNRMYGRRGFIQYQFAVPLHRDDVVRHALEKLAGAGLPSTLAVLKRFGDQSHAPLSFPLPGWTLALDLALPADGAARILDKLDEEVATAGGRVYFAKDARLRAELLPTMYPRLTQWHAERAALDPQGVFQSDLSRRLGLGGA